MKAVIGFTSYFLSPSDFSFLLFRHQGFHKKNYLPAIYTSLLQASNPMAPLSIHSLLKSSSHPKECPLQVSNHSCLPLLSLSTSIGCSPVVCILVAASAISCCLW